MSQEAVQKLENIIKIEEVSKRGLGKSCGNLRNNGVFMAANWKKKD